MEVIFFVIIAKVEQWLITFILLSMLSAVLFGKWTDHVKGWRHTELGDRIMYITYEEMVEVKHFPNSHSLMLSFC